MAAKDTTPTLDDRTMDEIAETKNLVVKWKRKVFALLVQQGAIEASQALEREKAKEAVRICDI